MRPAHRPDVPAENPVSLAARKLAGTTESHSKESGPQLLYVPPVESDPQTERLANWRAAGDALMAIFALAALALGSVATYVVLR